MSQIKKLINQKFLEGIDSTKFHVAQNGAIMAKDSSGSMVEFLKVNSDNKGVVLGKVISTKNELDEVIADLAQEILDRQAGDVDAKAYADQKIADLVNGAPALLDTLKELADSIANDPNFAATMATQLGQLQSDLATEIARAEAAELALGIRIDGVESDVSALEGRMDTAEADIIGVETRMQSAEGRLSLLEPKVDTLESGLAQEILDREAGDEQALADAKAYTDAEVLEEKGLREAADAQVLVDAKAYTDAEVSEEMGRAEGIENLLRSDLNAEIQSRTDGDIALGQEIDAERDARIAEDALKVNKSGDTMTGNLIVSFNEAYGEGETGGVSLINGEDGATVSVAYSGFGQEYKSEIIPGEMINTYSDESSSSSGRFSVNGVSFENNNSSSALDGSSFHVWEKDPETGNYTYMLEGGVSQGFFHSSAGPDGARLPVMPSEEFQMTPKKYVDDQDSAKLQEAKDYTDAEVLEEKTARQAADTELVNTMTSYYTSLQGEIAIEAAARVQGDANTLQSSKDYTDEKMAEEVSARDAAILVEKNRAEGVESGLQSAIDVEKGRVDAILLASDADKDSFAEIVQLINSVDTENDSAFASYVLSNNAALAQEVTDRQSGDTTLQSNIDAEMTRAMAAESALSEDLAEEVSRAQGAEGVLQSNIEAEAAARGAADTVLQNNIDAEASARQSADEALDGRLDSAEASIVSLSSSKADKSYVDSQDAGLQSQIDGLDGRMDTAESDINNLESVKANITYVDAQIAAAQANLDDVEGYAQDIRDDLDAEIARAEGAEGELSDRLDILEALAFHKESKVAGSSDLSYVELALEAKPYSIAVFVGRLALHEGQDFSVSVVGGKSRITWMGDFMVGGVEEIEEGMKLFFHYYC
jgi:hypothetical protein